MYKTLGFKWFCQRLLPATTLATADSDEARNPQRFIHVSVIGHPKKDTDRQTRTALNRQI
jgi:hypothetical protein